MSSFKESPDPLYVLRGANSQLSCLKFENSATLWSGTYTGHVYSWSMETRRISQTILAHPGHSVLWMEFILGTGSLLTQGRDGSVKIWAQSESCFTETGTLLCSSLGFCNSALVDQHTLAVPANGMSTVDIFDIRNHTNVSTLLPDQKSPKLGMCMKMCIANDRSLLVGYEDGSVALWDIGEHKMVSRLQLHADAVMCLDYCSKLTKGFSGSVSEDIFSCVLNNNTIVKKTEVKVTNAGFSDCKVRRDGKIVAFAGWDSNVRIFGAKHLKPLAVLNYHKEGVQCVTFSEDYLMACGSKDQLISLWDLYR
ncbi:guanine nucleotide-binding protein subunit beta-like protein 1 [Mya arenaria]|uniref:guanine nucleotide-binding protein subunit beta-like protein 1 n=1 Tax=Mya arenaria TaxID=6604 RepID=UPI0022E4E689|nr:guanine nucleotide-binding protein subunit beta-like protein 1 [Mya arenaria]XP_052807260.1 guanine nucleotide-binding protein subunit beta-like protein 1 [Mya arenaria]XP_052807261.1 guanine nucleotide-binding protein subunit beta-like protein 1 [Mya arenaria]